MKCDNIIPYREVIRSLSWLNQVAKYCCDNQIAHWNAWRRILRYLYSAVRADVTSKDMTNVPMQNEYFASKRPRDVDASLETYVNGDFETLLMTDTLYLDMRGLFSWQSRSLSTVALSTGDRIYGSSYLYAGGLLALISV